MAVPWSCQQPLGPVKITSQGFSCLENLEHLLLPGAYISGDRTAPFIGHDLLGPRLKEFDQDIFQMWDWHILHVSKTKYLKTPITAAPKPSPAITDDRHLLLSGTPACQDSVIISYHPDSYLFFHWPGRMRTICNSKRSDCP